MFSFPTSSVEIALLNEKTEGEEKMANVFWTNCLKIDQARFSF